MAYTAPNVWEHADNDVNDVNLQALSDDLEYIHDKSGDLPIVKATLARLSSAEFYIKHRQRYLFYRSTGAIVDLANIEDNVSLAEDEGAGQFQRYDLETIDWLTYGTVYKVTGCGWCGEDDNP